VISLTDDLEFRSVQAVPPRAKSKHYGKKFPLVDGIVALGSVQLVREECHMLALQVLIFLLQTSPTAVVRCISDYIERLPEVRRIAPLDGARVLQPLRLSDVEEQRSVLPPSPSHILAGEFGQTLSYICVFCNV
jgi:hypothetical protein